MKHVAAGLALVFILAGPVCEAARADPRSDKVDALFAAFNANTPGCAVGVMDRGEILYSHAYGMANLELGVPLKTDSVFSIASMSKQFTAMAIVLLAEDGKLSFGDSVQKYFPELPDYGHAITIANLLHHTSGLKDLDQLLQLSGVRLPFDLMTRQMALDLILRQRTLNFAPGEHYAYSDTNYFLLGLIVERVSGQSLPDFAQHRIFGPLGMQHSEFRKSASAIIPNLASGYSKSGDTIQIAPDNDEVLGDSGVYTTLEDLAQWDGNFYNAKVGGGKGIQLMLAQTRLNDGTVNVYAAGLKVQPYRGLTMVEHAGDLVGYQSELVRFPDQQIGVAVLCNQRGGFDATHLALGVASIYLEKEFAAARPHSTAPQPPASPPEAKMKSYGGIYWDEESGNLLKFSHENGNLALVAPSDGDLGPLESLGNGKFRFETAIYKFSNDAAQVMVYPSQGQPVRYARVAAAQSAALADFAGTFYSADIDRTWTISVGAGHLILARPGFAAEPLDKPLFRDAFDSDLALLHFNRSATGEVEGFDAINYRLQKIRFDREKASRQVKE